MSKYIDADKLIAEIESLKENTFIGICEYDNGVENGRMEVLTSLKSIITSLQQDEKAIELEMCSQAYWEERGWIMIPPDVTLEGINSLLKQVRKKLGQDQPEVDLEKELKEHIDDEWSDEWSDDVGNWIRYRRGTTSMEVEDVKEIARHFYELGLNAREEE